MIEHTEQVCNVRRKVSGPHYSKSIKETAEAAKGAHSTEIADTAKGAHSVEIAEAAKGAHSMEISETAKGAHSEEITETAKEAHSEEIAEATKGAHSMEITVTGAWNSFRATRNNPQFLRPLNPDRCGELESDSERPSAGKGVRISSSTISRNAVYKRNETASP